MLELLPFIAGAFAGRVSVLLLAGRRHGLAWGSAALGGVAVSVLEGEHTASVGYPIMDALLGGAGWMAVRVAEEARRAHVSTTAIRRR